MLESIKLHFTETGEIDLPVGGVTIFVGPNNSGKSLVLREFMELLKEHPFPQGLKIIRDYEVSWPSEAAVDQALQRFDSIQQPGLPLGTRTVGAIYPNEGLNYNNISVSSLKTIVRERQDKHWIATQYMRWSAISLDGRSRFNLTNDQGTGDLLGTPGNILQQLFNDDSARKRVQDVIYDAFKLYFVIDPTAMTTFRIRLSEAEPLANTQSLDAEARAYHGAAHHIKELSDGVQAFTGIVSAVYSGEYDTILIDEPEAFLHPPLARKLGKNLARAVAERSGALIASTHSPDFLMGCVQAVQDVRVVRLEYQSGKSRAKLVDPTALDTLFRNPIMRSANVASGLFYDGVIVTESDNDRVFYSEVYQRLAELSDAYPSILFVNAQNKQTMRDIVGPLRRFGVPAAAIADIDVVKDGGADWTQWMEATNVPSALRVGLGQQRSSMKIALEATGRDMKRDGGLGTLSGSEALAGEQFFDQLDKYGLFAVRRGEVENWLPYLGVPGKKTAWALGMLSAMGSDPRSASYVKPGSDDVWKFIECVVDWIRDSTRWGMP